MLDMNTDFVACVARSARCGTCPLCKRHELAPEDAELAIHWDIDFAKMEWSIARVTPACLCSPAPAMACPLCRSALHAPASREGKGSLKPSIVRSHCREVGDADALLNAMLQVSDAAGEVAFAGLAAHLLAANGLGKERGEAVQAALNATHAVKVSRPRPILPRARNLPGVPELRAVPP